jgi:hypothetical protein
VLPQNDYLDDSLFSTERKILEKEFDRILEFADLAINGPQVRARFLDVLDDFQLLHLLGR